MAAGSLGATLVELRERAGLTQKLLADRAGVAQATIANIEQGRNMPSLVTAASLAAALGVTTEDLLKGSAASTKRGRGRPAKRAAPGSKDQQKRRLRRGKK